MLVIFTLFLFGMCVLGSAMRVTSDYMDGVTTGVRAGAEIVFHFLLLVLIISSMMINI